MANTPTYLDEQGNPQATPAGQPSAQTSPIYLDENGNSQTPSQPSMFPGSAPSGNMYPGAQQSDNPSVDVNSTKDTSGPGVSNAIARGITAVGSDIPNPFKAIKQAVTHPVDTVVGLAKSTPAGTVYDGVKNSVSGYEAYEKARASGLGVEDSMKIASDTMTKQDGAVQMAKQRVDEFKKDPSGQSVRSALDALGIVGSFFMGGPETAAGEATPELAAGESATPEAVESTSTTSEAVTPKEAAVSKAVAKAPPISEGTPETVAPTGEDIQPALQQGIRNHAVETAKSAGLEPPTSDVDITDVHQDLADKAQVRSQGTFDKVKELTGVDPTAMKDVMSTRADQIELRIAEGKASEATDLQKLQVADEAKMEQAFKDAVKKDPTANVDQARTDWNTSLRADESSAAVRGSTSNTHTQGIPDIDAGKLTPRLQRLNMSQPGGKVSKLQQLPGGADNADALVESAEQARTASQDIKNFVPKTATGRQALTKYVSDATTQKAGVLGKVGARTEWSDVVKNIGNSPTAKVEFGSELPKVLQYAGKQAAKQLATRVLIGGSPIEKLAKLGAAAEAVRRTVKAIS